MHIEPISHAVFLIFAGAAVLGTLVPYARQSLLFLARPEPDTDLVVAADAPGRHRQRASCVVPLATVLIVMASSYYITLRYFTPSAVSARRRQD